MILRRKWWIRNDYEERVFAFVAKADDTDFVLALNDLATWIEPGKVWEFNVQPDKVKIGFRKGQVPVWNGWFAEPKLKRTNQDVVLTKDLKIEYRSGSVAWHTPESGELVYFISPAQFNNVPRSLVMAGLGKIPTVGGVLSTITGVVWPEMKDNARSLVDASENRMRSWVRGEINKLKLSDLEDQLDALRRNLKSYQNTKDPLSRRIILLDCLASANAAMSKLIHGDASALIVGDDPALGRMTDLRTPDEAALEVAKRDDMLEVLRDAYVPGTAAIAIDVAAVHLGLLRERVVFREEMEFPEVDFEKAKLELKEAIAEYQAYFAKIAVPMENAWRKASMVVSADKPRTGNNLYTIEDKVTRQIHGFADGIRGYSRNTANSWVNSEYYQEQARNSFAASLLTNVGDAARLFTLLDPDRADERPVPLDRVTEVGPASGLVNKSGNEHDARRTILLATPDHATINKIIVRSGDEIDHLTFEFEDAKSMSVGNPKGGAAHTVSVSRDNPIRAVESWWDWELCALRFHMMDGTKTAVFGKHKVPGKSTTRHHQYSELPDHYVSGFSFEGKPDDDSGKRVGNGMWVAFKPVRDFYET